MEIDPAQGASVALDKWALVPEVGRAGATQPGEHHDDRM